MIEAQHKKYNFEYTNEDLANKVKLIDFNRTNYEKHMSNVNNKSTKEFGSKLVEYVRKNKRKYEVDWEKRYNKWQTSQG